MARPLKYSVPKILRLTPTQHENILSMVEKVNEHFRKKYEDVNDYYELKTNASEYMRAKIFPEEYASITEAIEE